MNIKYAHNNHIEIALVSENQDIIKDLENFFARKDYVRFNVIDTKKLCYSDFDIIIYDTLDIKDVEIYNKPLVIYVLRKNMDIDDLPQISDHLMSYPFDDINIFELKFDFFVKKLKLKKQNLQYDFGIVFDNILSGVLILKIPETATNYWDWTIVDVNQTFCKIAKVNKKDIVSKNIGSLYTDWRLLSNKYERFLLAKKSFTTEVFSEKTNTFFEVLVSFPATDIVVLLLNNITKRKRTENKLKASEERFHSFVAMSSDGIIIVDVKGIVREWNKGIESITGINEHYALGKPIWDLEAKLVRPEFADQFRRQQKNMFDSLQILLGSNKSHDRYFREIRSLDGTIKHVQYVWFPIQTPDNVMIGYIVRDMSDIKSAMDRLGNSEYSLKRMQEIAKIGNWEYDIDDNKQYWSEQIYEILDLPLDFKLSLDSFINFVFDQDRIIISDTIKKLEKLEKFKEERTIKILTLKKEIKYVNFIIEKNIKTNGNNALFGIIQDITKAKKNEIELTKSREELRQALETKNKFFSIIAHDLHNPFNHILGFSELLIDSLKEGETEDVEKYAKVIHSSAENTYYLLENLLNWARNQTHKIKYNPKKIDIIDYTKKRVAYYKNFALRKKLDFDYDIDFNIDNRFIFVDEDLFSATLRNLIANAIKFTPENGKITLVVRQENEKYLKLSVKDTGIGINKEQLPHIFNLVDKTIGTGTSGEKGTGLGLALCKEFTEINKGKISVQSTPGKGSVFTVTIPVYNGQEKNN